MNDRMIKIINKLKKPCLCSNSSKAGTVKEEVKALMGFCNTQRYESRGENTCLCRMLLYTALRDYVLMVREREREREENKRTLKVKSNETNMKETDNF